jgi:hypothetical protein
MLDKEYWFTYNDFMKIKNMNKQVILLVLVLMSFMVPQWGEDLKDKPDSVNYILGLNVNDNVLLEHPGDGIMDFKLYTTSSKTAILWKFQKNYYIYTISSGDHLLAGIELMKQLKTHGIETFVATKDGNSLRFNKYHSVVAFRLRDVQ